MIPSSTEFQSRIFSIKNETDFNACALELFCYQAEYVTVYRNFLKLLKIRPAAINHFLEIPYLPVTLFKNHYVTDQSAAPPFYFSSSGTTGQITSKHYVIDLSLYEESLLRCFRHFYGDPKEYCFLALLPSYLERPGSSLVYMLQHLMKQSDHPLNGFFLYNHDELALRMTQVKDGHKIFLLGVTYALLDFFREHPMQLKNTVVMETGGMKGKRKELIKQEVHDLLKTACGLSQIHSEYGMTELLSQAYSTGDGIFSCPPWMKIIISDLHDPFAAAPQHETGIIKVIDLANIHSCAFIETQDLGRNTGQNKFEVLGRMDNSELRGCNLMI